MRRAPLAAAAIASGTILAASAAPALAAGHAHEHGHARAHHHAVTDHGHNGKSQGHLEHQLRGASHALANQLRQVNRMLDVATNSDKVSDTDRADVEGALQADADALTGLQDQLTSATTHHDVVSVLHQGILTRAVARTQLTVALQAAAVRSAAGSSTDTTAAGTAGTDADSAVATVVALSTDSTRADIHDARKSAQADLADAETALGGSADDGSGDTGSTTTTTTTTDQAPTS